MQVACALRLLLPCLCLSFLAQTAHGQDCKPRKRAVRWEIADSIRAGIKRGANKQQLLAWGDSLLKAKLDSNAIDSKTYRHLQRRLRKYGNTFYRGDSLLSRRYNKITFDTTYISRPREKWMIKFRTNISGAKFESEGKHDGVPFNGTVKSDYRGTVSFAVSYSGLSLAMAINPAKLAGKNKDNEFNLNAYGNRFGFDVVLLSSKTYKGQIDYNHNKLNVTKGMVTQKATNLNAYYAFNGRKFSFPAAFSQSYLQRRSAGSFLLGASLDGQITKISGNELIGKNGVKLKIIEVGLGAGYGYNLTARKRWLFHLSTIPTFDVYVHSHITANGERVKLRYHFPNVIVVGRAAAVYSWKREFTGATLVFNFSAFGDRNNLHLNRDKWRLRVFYGFRF